MVNQQSYMKNNRRIRKYSISIYASTGLILNHIPHYVIVHSLKILKRRVVIRRRRQNDISFSIIKGNVNNDEAIFALLDHDLGRSAFDTVDNWLQKRYPKHVLFATINGLLTSVQHTNFEMKDIIVLDSSTYKPTYSPGTLFYNEKQ